ncbi:MAG: cysteine hydrolase [Acidimicrobiales bacterium]
MRASGTWVGGGVALLVIDMQKGGAMAPSDAGITHMAGFAERVGRICRVVAAARSFGIPVIFTQEVHRRDLADIGRELDGAEGVHCVEGDEGTELLDELLPGPGEHLVRKRRYSCFLGTDLDIVLRGFGVHTLLLAGCLTDVCVHYTFADAHQRDYVVRVLDDCVGGSSEAAHFAALDAMVYLQRDARLTSEDLLGQFGEVVPA